MSDRPPQKFYTPFETFRTCAMREYKGMTEDLDTVLTWLESGL